MDDYRVFEDDLVDETHTLELEEAFTIRHDSMNRKQRRAEASRWRSSSKKLRKSNSRKGKGNHV